MSEINSRVSHAIYTALVAADFEASHMTNDQLKAAARAAISAMREPTKEMKAVAPHMSMKYAQDEWRAMIDEALR